VERITSRKNQIITHLRQLAADGDYRRETGQFVCDGEKTLHEALASGAEIACVLWSEETAFKLPEGIAQYCCPAELLAFASPLKNSPGPVFSVKMRRSPLGQAVSSVIVLENVQDPGNVGTVLRTANALGADVVLLVGDCADLYHPKTVRASMGAIFRQAVYVLDLEELRDYVNRNDLRLFGAALSADAVDIRTLSLQKTAVAIGSEGRGLSDALLALCNGRLIIPMQPDSESLNAAVAAAIVLWEMAR
jgi:TrmH family RNA methyltransferase